MPAANRLTLTRAARLLASGKLTSVQLCTYCHELASLGDRPLHHLREDDGNGHDGPPGLGLNAFAHLSPLEQLLQHAAESDRRREAGLSLGPLDGIPISIKANVAAEGWLLSAGSRILNWRETKVNSETPDGQECAFDSDVVHRLLKGGGVIMGTTNMDEFGMGSLGNTLPIIPLRDEAKARPKGRRRDAGLVRNPLPYLDSLTPSFLTDGHLEEHFLHHNEDEVDEMWAQHVTTPLLWRHPDLLHDIASPSFDRHQSLSAGGSSSGSAVSVALGSSLLSVGTDTGGSVRLPAAWTGVVGLKPTYGLISRYGVVAYGSSLDTVGLLAPSVRCAATALDVVINRRSEPGQKDMSGKDVDERLTGDMDSTSVSVPVSTFMSKLLMDSENTDANAEPLKGLFIGIPSAFSVMECPPLIQKAWQEGIKRLRDAGATIKEISTEVVSERMIEASLSAYYVVACAEASSNLSRYDGVEFGADLEDLLPRDDKNFSGSPQLKSRNEEDGASNNPFSNLTELERRFSTLRSIGFGSEVTRRVLCGTSVLSSDRFHTHFEAATKIRAILAREFNAAFKTNEAGAGGNEVRVDLMLVPTALSIAPDLGLDGSHAPDPTEMFANDVMTVPISLTGLPSISVPVDVDLSDEEGTRAQCRAERTVGLQVFGPKLSEERVLLAASVLGEGR